MKKSDNVIKLVDPYKKSIQETLDKAKDMEFEDILIAGYDANDKFMITTSSMMNKDAVYLAHEIIESVFGEDEDA